LSGPFLQRSLFAAVDAILGAIDTSQTNTEEPAKIRANYKLWLNNTDCLSVFLCRLRITTHLRSGAVDKMAGIFTKRIWQPCICQPNEHGKLSNKLGGPSKNLGGGWPTQAPLRIATELISTVKIKRFVGWS